MSVLSEAEIVATVSEAELLSGVPPLIVASRAEIGPRAVVVTRRRLGGDLTSRAPAGRWSPEERAFVQQNLGYLSSAEMAARLGRSPNAIKILHVRQGWAAPSKLPDEVSVCRAAEMLGIDPKAVMRWTQSCGLRSRRLPLDRSIFTVRRRDLEAWVINPLNWVYVRPTSIRDQRLRRLCELRAARWADRWLTSGQVARLAGCRYQDINRWIRAGKVRGARKWGNWWVLESVAQRLCIPKGKGSGHEIGFSAASDLWMLLARGAGLAMVDIGPMCRMPAPRASHRVRTLLLRPSLRSRLDGMHGYASLRFRGQDCFLDWRLEAGRFPSVVRAAERLLTLGPASLSRRQCRVVRGVLHKWSAWYGLPCASALRFCPPSLTTSRRLIGEGWAALRAAGFDPFDYPLPLKEARQ